MTKTVKNKNYMLTAEEQKELFNNIRGKNHDAREEALNKLIKKNIRLVTKICHAYKHHGVPIGDLVSEGNLGLLRAAEKFNPERGVKFSTYATYWIKHAVHKALANQSKVIRIPAQTAENIRKVRTVTMKMSNELGRSPTHNEIAMKVGLTDKVVKRLIRDDVKTFSMHGSQDDSGNSFTQENFSNHVDVSPEQIMMRKESREHLNRLLQEELSDREGEILKMRYGMGPNSPRTLEQISVKVGLSRERVRQILKDSLQKLRYQIRKGKTKTNFMLAV